MWGQSIQEKINLMTELWLVRIKPMDLLVFCYIALRALRTFIIGGGMGRKYTHILEEFKLVKMSSNVPQETRFTNKLRVSFFGMF